MHLIIFVNRNNINIIFTHDDLGAALRGRVNNYPLLALNLKLNKR